MPKYAPPSPEFRSLEQAIMTTLERIGPVAMTNVSLRPHLPGANFRQIENCINKLKMRNLIYHWREDKKFYFTANRFRGQAVKVVKYKAEDRIASLNAAFGLPSKVEMTVLLPLPTANACKTTGGTIYGHGSVIGHVADDMRDESTCE